MKSNWELSRLIQAIAEGEYAFDFTRLSFHCTPVWYSELTTVHKCYSKNYYFSTWSLLEECSVTVYCSNPILKIKVVRFLDWVFCLEEGQNQLQIIGITYHLLTREPLQEITDKLWVGCNGTSLLPFSRKWVSVLKSFKYLMHKRWPDCVT